MCVSMSLEEQVFQGFRDRLGCPIVLGERAVTDSPLLQYAGFSKRSTGLVPWDGKKNTHTLKQCWQ